MCSNLHDQAPMYSLTEMFESTIEIAKSFRYKPLKYWTGKDIVSWGRWVCQCEGIQELNIDFSILGTLNGELLIQASQHDLELMVGDNIGHIFYAYLTDIDCDIRNKTMLPLTVEEFNENINDNTYLPFCEDISASNYAHLIDIQNEYNNLDENNNYPNNCDKSYQDFECQDYENYEYNCDENRNICHLSISDENIPDLNALGAYCELDRNDTEINKNNDDCRENRVHNILSQDLCKKIVTKSRRKERCAKNWEFLVRLLVDPRTNPEVVSWVDHNKGTFRLVQPHVVVSLWNSKSNKTPVSYHSFARGLRYHYKTGALFLVAEHQLMYGCGPEALNYLQELLN